MFGAVQRVFPYIVLCSRGIFSFLFPAKRSVGLLNWWTHRCLHETCSHLIRPVTVAPFHRQSSDFKCGGGSKTLSLVSNLLRKIQNSLKSFLWGLQNDCTENCSHTTHCLQPVLYSTVKILKIHLRVISMYLRNPTGGPQFHLINTTSTKHVTVARQ